MKKNFLYISIMGGIGDQIFQYSFANYLRNKLNCKGFLDTSYYNNKSNYNNFVFRLKNLAEKNNFKIVNNISYLNHNVLSYLRLIELFKINKIFTWIYKIFFKKPIQFFIYEYWKERKKITIKNNSYYFGYWHNFNYIKPIKMNINKNLIDAELKKFKLIKFKKKIHKKTVAIHIRGGDFKFLPSHNLLSYNYYSDAIKFYKKLLKNPKFHIYTNDIKLSKKIILKILENKDIIFIKDLKFSDIEEFSLFSKYNYAIIANSTFSLMSSYLSMNRNLSIAPKIWLKGKRLDKNKKFSKLKFI